MAILLRPNDEEREDLARALEVEAAPELEAEIFASPWLDGLEIAGRIQARLVRTCGVSLEPFEEVIDETFARRLVPLGSRNAGAGERREVLIDPDQADPPDEVEGAGVDLAALVTEELALALDPFPRKPGTVFESPAMDADVSPFAALARLKAQQDKA
jgi:hypothetical protein